MINESSSTSGGIGLGGVIAIVWSWTTNHSVLWCIVHGLFYRIFGFGSGK
jgi:hypothetical protein